MDANERKKAHLDRLKAKYVEAQAKVELKEGAAYRKYRKKIVDDGCFHPETYDWVENCDNGYGRWWKVKLTKCKLCEKVLKTDHNA